MLLDYTKIAHLHLIDKRNMSNFIHSAESSALTQKNSLFNQVFFISLCPIVKRSFDLMQDEEKCGTPLVSKSLPVENLAIVNRSFSKAKTNSSA